MNKLLIATILATTAMLSQASAQTISERDAAIARLTDDRDMSTGLAHNPPKFVSQRAQSQSARDRAIAKLTDDRDMSTGLPHR